MRSVRIGATDCLRMQAFAHDTTDLRVRSGRGERCCGDSAWYRKLQPHNKLAKSKQVHNADDGPTDGWQSRRSCGGIACVARHGCARDGQRRWNKAWGVLQLNRILVCRLREPKGSAQHCDNSVAQNRGGVVPSTVVGVGPLGSDLQPFSTCKFSIK
jgi:hypothetical protein